jgi:hypothetical protein
VAARTRFLCWNINRKPLQGLVAALTRSRDIDAVILLESGLAPGVVLESLNDGLGTMYHLATTPGTVGGEEIQIYTRSPDTIRPLQDGPGFTIRQASLNSEVDIVLAAVHFPSKLHWDEDSQALECTRLARTIADAEKRAGHNRTVVVGDLNMNPFEAGIVGAAGLNATMVRNRALKESRNIRGERYPFFFNPMWGLFGGYEDKPPGTYYRDSAQQVNYYWNMFDQVLIRPSLLGMLPQDGIEIVTRAGRFPLLTATGLPNRASASDHLPLLFSLGY